MFYFGNTSNLFKISGDMSPSSPSQKGFLDSEFFWFIPDAQPANMFRSIL